jgi:hypothetical protein
LEKLWKDFVAVTGFRDGPKAIFTDKGLEEQEGAPNEVR